MKKELAESFIDKFPEVPEELRKEAWAEMNCFILYDHYGNARCTGCGHEFEIENGTYHHCSQLDRWRQSLNSCLNIGVADYCPCCCNLGYTVDVTKGFKGENAEDFSNVAIFIAGEDGNLYVRCFTIEIKFKHGDIVPNAHWQETHRYVFTKELSARFGLNGHWLYENEQYYHLFTEWTVRKQMAMPQYSTPWYYGDTMIGLENIERTWMKYSLPEKLLEKNDVNIYQYLKFFRTHQGAEKLMKCGFEYCLGEMVKSRDEAKLVDWKKSELTKMLGFTKGELGFARKNPTCLSYYLRVKRRFPDLTLEKGVELCECFSGGNLGLCLQDEISEAVPNVNIVALAKYLKKYGSAGMMYRDYITMCKKLDYDLTDRMIIYPPHLIAAHDRASSAIRAIQAEKEKQKHEQERKNFEKFQKKRKKLEFEFEDLVIVVPKNCSEIVREGKVLKHCVGGFTDQVWNGTTNILFVRKKTKPKTPYFTIEVTNYYTIRQCHGYQNEFINGKKIEKPDQIKRLEEAYQEYLNEVKKGKRKPKQKVRKTA